MKIEDLPDKIDSCTMLKYEVSDAFEVEGKAGVLKKLRENAEEVRGMAEQDWLIFCEEVKDMKIPKKTLDAYRKKSFAMSGTWDCFLERDKLGKVCKTMDNLFVIFTKHPEIAGSVGMNEFIQRPCVVKNVPYMPHIEIDHFMEVSDVSLCHLRLWLSKNYADFAKDMIIDAIQSIADMNRFNPLADILEECAIEWDGVERVSSWLFEYCGAEVDDVKDKDLAVQYIREVGKNWLVSAVARALKPGCKVDHCLILEGGQGDRKSTLIEELSIGFYLELTTSLTRTKDVVDLMFGKWLVEMPELRALCGDTDGNKAFLTKRSDKERMSYARFSQDYPRRCVFIGTTNNDQYLHDVTGNRRFWPVRTSECDVDAIRRDARQLWGEAVLKYRSGEKWWIEPGSDVEGMAEKVQGIKKDRDDSEEGIEEWIKTSGKADFFTSEDVWINYMSGKRKDFDKKVQMRIGQALRNIGCAKVVDRNKYTTKRGWKLCL